MLKSSDQGTFFVVINCDPGCRWFYRTIGSDFIQCKFNS